MACAIGVAVACTRGATPERLDPEPLLNRMESPAAATQAPPQPTAPALPASTFEWPFRTAPARATQEEIPGTLSASAQAEVAVLLDANGFARGGVGVAGTPPEALLAAERLVAQPDAVAAFEWLVVNGSAAGRLYAYWGLLTLDRTRADAHTRELFADADAVSTMSGCIMDAQTVSAVAASAQRWPPLTANRH